MKYQLQIISGACIAALALCVPLSATAQTKKASPSPAASPADSPSPSKPTRSLPYKGTISEVDQDAKTFTIAGKEKSRVFKVTDKTTITKEDEAATMKDLAAGTKVTGSYWKHEDGSLEARSVKIKGMDEGSSTSPSPSPKP
jgi:hypothetical protein